MRNWISSCGFTDELVKNKTNLGGLTMKFSEAVQAMLDGKKVKRPNTTGVCYDYIVLDVDGDTVDSNGSQVILSKRDFIADWEIASIPSAGTLLMRYGKPFRLIEETDGTYAILDEETHVEMSKGIDEKDLVSLLDFQEFSIASTSDEDGIKDGDLFENEYGLLVRVRKLSNGKYALLNDLVSSYTKQELWKQARKYHLKKVTDNE